VLRRISKKHVFIAGARRRGYKKPEGDFLLKLGEKGVNRLLGMEARERFKRSLKKLGKWTPKEVEKVVPKSGYYSHLPTGRDRKKREGPWWG